MTRFQARRAAALLALVAVTGAIAACADKALSALTPGTPKDSVLRVVGQSGDYDAGSPIKRNANYLTGGMMLEVLYYSRKTAGEGETLDTKDYTPLVLINDTLQGTGWAYWDSVATIYKIEHQKP